MSDQGPQPEEMPPNEPTEAPQEEGPASNNPDNPPSEPPQEGGRGEEVQGDEPGED